MQTILRISVLIGLPILVLAHNIQQGRERRRAGRVR